MANKKSIKTKNIKFKILETKLEMNNRLFKEFFLFHLKSLQRVEFLFYEENKIEIVNYDNFIFGKIYNKDFLNNEYNFCIKTLLYNEKELDSFENFCKENKIKFVL